MEHKEITHLSHGEDAFVQSQKAGQEYYDSRWN